jgi:hypothetical protein
VRYTDQNRELFKLQAAAQHYETDLEMSCNYLAAFILSVLIFSLSGVSSDQFTFAGGVLMWSGCFVVAALLLWWRVRKYNAAIKRLDLYLDNLERGQPAPSLVKLTKD